MDDKQISNEERIIRANDAVKVSFHALQIVVHMIDVLAKNHPWDDELAELSRSLGFIAHQLYGNVTCMKLANGWPVFDAIKKEIPGGVSGNENG